MRFSKHLAVAAVAALGYGMAAQGIALAGAGPSWVIQSTPSPGGHQGSILLGVSCPSARACTAVGAIAPLAGFLGTIVEHWNGKKWAVQPAPRVKDGALKAVSCWSGRACIAVGYDRKGTLAERWNGRKWAVQPMPRVKNGMLMGVSCPSAKACTAVGGHGNDTLAERWDGRKWAVQSALNPVTGTDFRELVGVSCSSATCCTAVGDSDSSDDKSDTLTEHWNGVKWAIQAAKPPSGNESWLTGVSCLSARDCTAVGTYGTTNRSFTLAERWNDAKWVVQSTPNPSRSLYNDLTGVSCPSARACTAVGDNSREANLAERWNGTKWALQHAPNPPHAGASPLLGVSCSSATACTAVGPYVTKKSGELTLAERYS